ncbi:glutaredoxin family protein [Sphingomonas morindae]|uniref:Methylamine utilization protein MauE n=1 Tax=Sphingomonas morindae TaxID=1541170 RepID=A0ABY4XDT6_9SPHN|nr:glutaredoxin [Sphingomonas morindae]USI74855.1 glutaredoxin [Sphingomonas morindae]
MAKQQPHAELTRMVMGTHICPWGLRARHDLRRAGYAVDDHWLTTRAEVDGYKAAAGVATTPQIVIGGQRIGGYDDLRRFLGKPVRDPAAPSYRPVLALFAMTALMALAASQAAFGTIFTGQAALWFLSFSMCVLALLKLQDVDRFVTMFLGYDLLARRYLPYARLYPFAEGLAGLAMASGVATQVAAPLALVIGGIGAVSVVKAVYIDKRALTCACVGGAGKVPLGFVSLLENLAMVAMGLGMIAAPALRALA